ncbi:MAG: HD domain-containing protein [Gammaproteobacteria bacterium]|nr:MAG: HD domain-containing protein [Gammaproteobacteria bacterium]
MSKIKLTTIDLKIDEAVGYSIYDSDDRLILKPGSVITSERQIESLLRNGAYRYDEDDLETKKRRSISGASAIKVSNELQNLTPFDVLHNIFQRLRLLFETMNQEPFQIEEQTKSIAKIIINLFKRDKEALIGAIRLMHEYDYTLCHPVHTAIISTMISNQLSYSFKKQVRLICAALTQNISMNDLQRQLQDQKERLTKIQKEAVSCHPKASVTILEACGVTDKRWLEIVEQHHEQVDGKGYPNNIIGDNIIEEARIISIADKYSAMISGRTHRPGMHNKDVIKKIGSERGKETDAKLTMILVGALGVYPPGSFVLLSNGEHAVVIRRSLDPKRPIVSSYADNIGKKMHKPIIRNLDTQGLDIKEHIVPDKALRIDMNLIWGFSR